MDAHVWDMLVDWLASGIDPERATHFIQSRVPQHAELHLLLSMITPLGWLLRVPSFKDQQQQLKGLPSPRAARIGSVFGWLLVGVKYAAWIGGLFMLIPLGVIELLCGQREPDGPAFMQ